MKLVDRFKYAFVVLTVLVLLFLSLDNAYASGADFGAEASSDSTSSSAADAVVGDIVGGSNSYSSRALGLGNTSFDVDIGDCVVSTATSLVVFSWQRFQENPWCQAMTAIRLQQYDMAERILCRDTKWGTYFTDEQECRSIIEFDVAPTIVEVPEEHFEEEEEWHQEQMEMQQDYDERIERLEQKVRTAQRSTTTSDFAQRAARAKAILEGDEE